MQNQVDSKKSTDRPQAELGFTMSLWQNLPRKHSQHTAKPSYEEECLITHSQCYAINIFHKISMSKNFRTDEVIANTCI